MTDAELLTQFAGQVGAPPPAGGVGPECLVCKGDTELPVHSTWIEIGGGSAADVYHPNVDIREVPGVDIVMDAGNQLPFHDGHAEKIKAIHVINHMSLVKARALLGECFRVLRSGGSLFIMVTDMEFVLGRIAQDGLRDCWAGCIWGTKGDTYADDFHYWGYTAQSLESELKDAGFQAVKHRGHYNPWEFKMEAWK